MPDNPHQILRSRVAIFRKGELYGLIALAITPTQNVVSRLDPRANPAVTYKGFETPTQADHWFEEYVIATVSENHWSVAYNGPRNLG